MADAYTTDQLDDFMPFGPSEARRLQELTNGLSQVDNDLADGDILPETAEQARAQIQPQLQGLLARQQKTQQTAKQKSVQDALEQQSLVQSVGQANAEHSAQGFQVRTATYTEPITGAHRVFYQPEPGKWAPIDFAPEGGGETERSMMTNYVPPQPGLDQSISITQGAGPTRVYGRDATGHVTGVQTVDSRTGQPIEEPAQQPAEQGGLSQAAINELYRRAQQSIPRPQLTGNPRIDGPNLNRWQSLVAQTTNHLVSVEAQKAAFGNKVGLTSDEHRKQEEFRAAQQKDRLEGQTKRRQDDAKELHRIMDDMRKDPEAQGLPRADLLKRAKSEFADLHGREFGVHEGEHGGGKPTVSDLAGIAAELQRRGQQAPGVPPGTPAQPAGDSETPLGVSLLTSPAALDVAQAVVPHLPGAPSGQGVSLPGKVGVLARGAGPVAGAAADVAQAGYGAASNKVGSWLEYLGLKRKKK